MNSKELVLGIREYDFPENLCNKIKNEIVNGDMYKWVNSGVGVNQIDTSIRSSKNYVLDQNSIIIEKIKSYIYQCLDDYCEKYLTNYTKKVDLGILKYSNGGHYLGHSDSDYIFYRTISILIYLNPDEYSGGETHFTFFDLKVKPKLPKLVVFPSNYIYNHAALPVTDGEKYVIVGWLNDVPEEV